MVILRLESFKFRKTVHIFKIFLRQKFFSVRSLCSCVYGLKCIIGKILIFSTACINTWHSLTAFNEPWWLIYGTVKLWMNVGLKWWFCKLLGRTAARNYAGFLLLYFLSQPHQLSATSVHLRMKSCWYLFPGKHWVAFIFGLSWLLWFGTGHSPVVKFSDRGSRWCLKPFYLKHHVLKHKWFHLPSGTHGVPNLHTRPILLLWVRLLFSSTCWNRIFK